MPRVCINLPSRRPRRAGQGPVIRARRQQQPTSRWQLLGDVVPRRDRVAAPRLPLVERIDDQPRSIASIPPSSNRFARGFAINDSSGGGGEFNNDSPRAFVHNGTSITGLTRLGGNNDYAGVIVGMSTNGAVSRATRWVGGVASDLGDDCRHNDRDRPCLDNQSERRDRRPVQQRRCHAAHGVRDRFRGGWGETGYNPLWLPTLSSARRRSWLRPPIHRRLANDFSLWLGNRSTGSSQPTRRCPSRASSSPASRTRPTD